jgi:hypothetical protein
MHWPTCIFWANLTPFSLGYGLQGSTRALSVDLGGVGAEVATDRGEVILRPRYLIMMDHP